MRDILKRLAMEERAHEPIQIALRDKNSEEVERLADLIFEEIQRGIDHEFAEPINLREAVIQCAYAAIAIAKQEFKHQQRVADEWRRNPTPHATINPVQIARDMGITVDAP